MPLQAGDLVRAHEQKRLDLLAGHLHGNVTREQNDASVAALLALSPPGQPLKVASVDGNGPDALVRVETESGSAVGDVHSAQFFFHYETDEQVATKAAKKAAVKAEKDAAGRAEQAERDRMRRQYDEEMDRSLQCGGCSVL